MQNFSKKEIGDLGEDLACKFLKRKGFIVVDRNYWQKFGEIDIVARKRRIVHFIEVKTVLCRTLESEGMDNYRPEDNVHIHKLKRLARTIETYIFDKNLDSDFQIDVITVKLDVSNKKAKVQFLGNIVL